MELAIEEVDASRFWSRVTPADSNGCMLWTGSLVQDGYGNFRVGERQYRAHRVALLVRRGSTLRDWVQSGVQ